MFVAADGAPGEICKWQDESGTVHYAEECPEEIESARVEIQPPPSQARIHEADSRYAAAERGEDSGDATVPAGSDTARMREMCIQARLSLSSLDGNRPVYFDQRGQLQSENYQSVRNEYDRGARHLSADARARELEHWTSAEQDNCTPEVVQSGIRSDIRRRQNEHQQRECDWWGLELEYMERNKGYHAERLDLKRQFNARCK
jgi:hypothetical protein